MKGTENQISIVSTSNIFNHNLCFSLQDTIKVRVDLDFLNFVHVENYLSLEMIKVLS